MLGRIYGLLTQKERRRGIWVALSVLTRALLDFAGIAALIPILLAVFGEKTDIRKALLVCLCALVFVLLKNAVSIGLARFPEPLSARPLPGFQQEDVLQLLSQGIAFPEREEQRAAGT